MQEIFDSKTACFSARLTVKNRQLPVTTEQVREWIGQS
jgi:hypothetical protein